ncbi:Listeria/Bacterioides repeat [Acidimicrobiia bacterium]
MRIRALRAVLASLALAVVALMAIAGTQSRQPVNAATVNNNMIVIIPTTLQPIPFTVTFDSNGGTGSMVPMTFTATGRPLTANSFTRAGFTFAGWATTPTGSVAYANSAVYNTIGNVTLYAVWTPVTYTVTFSANGGSGSMAAMTFTATGRALTANSFTRAGYTFAGWARSATGAVAFANSAVYNTIGNVTLFAVWTPIEYTITFNANGGTGTMPAQVFTVVGEPVNANSFARVGYTFAGWATTPTGPVAVANSATYNTAGNVNLYAVWTPIEYTINFSANGGTGTMPAQVFTVVGEPVNANTFTRAGYTFAGWATTPTGPVAVANSATYNTAGNVTLFAVWTLIDYTITFNANGGTGTMPAQVFTVVGEPVNANTFTRAGYTFAGWARSATGAVAVANSATYNTAGNVTLFAVWTPIEYTINFNANGGTGTMAAQVFTVVGEPVNANTFTRAGYTFAGWATTPTGPVAVANSATYNTAGNVTLFAVWTPVDYTITFNANGGTGTMPAQVFTVVGEPVNANTFTRAGYTFAGWARSATGAVAVANSATYNTAGNVTLFAVWTPVDYTITFNANGGTGTMAAQVFTVVGEPVNANAFTREGYTFAGWARSATGAVAVANSATYNTAGNVILYAVWTPIEYTITFNANGGTGTMPAQVFTVVGEPVNANTFTRAGYTFAGWSKTATGAVAVANSATYNTAGNVALFAVWTPVDYTITFNANGGTGTMPAQVFTVLGEPVNANTFTRAGYTFAGWARSATGAVAVANSATYNTAGNVTLFAVWTPITYTVTFNANGGTGTMAAMTFTTTGRALTANTFTRAGYAFAGWARTATGTVAFANSAVYNTAGNVTLFAVWTLIDYTITFNANGGTGTMAAQVFTVVGEPVNANTFTRAGYTFAGWARSATGAVAVANSATYNTIGNVTLFAVWTPITYTVTFNANGGTGSMAPMTFTVTGKALTANTFTRAGYTFAGWARSATGAVAVANSATYNTIGNVTLFAVWTPITYTVTFNANGGTGSMAAMTFTAAGRALTANTFTRAGFTFAGWATSATGAVVFANSATYNTIGNVTLYAKWR